MGGHCADGVHLLGHDGRVPSPWTVFETSSVVLYAGLFLVKKWYEQKKVKMNKRKEKQKHTWTICMCVALYISLFVCAAWLGQDGGHAVRFSPCTCACNRTNGQTDSLLVVNSSPRVRCCHATYSLPLLALRLLCLYFSTCPSAAACLLLRGWLVRPTYSPCLCCYSAHWFSSSFLPPHHAAPCMPEQALSSCAFHSLPGVVCMCSMAQANILNSCIAVVHLSWSLS